MMKQLAAILVVLLLAGTAIAEKGAPAAAKAKKAKSKQKATVVAQAPDAAPAPAPPAEPAPAPSAAPEGLRPLHQVQIKAWISETNEQGLRDIGANLKYTRFVEGVEQNGELQQVTTNVYDPANPTYSVTLPAPDSTLFPSPLRPDLDGETSGIQGHSGAGLAFSIIDSDHGTIEGVFRGVERNADIDLISKPELLVIDKIEANIHAGGKVPFQHVTYDARGLPRLSVEFQPIGVNMKLVPTILSDDRVELNISQLEVTDIARIDNIRGVDLPVFSTRSQAGKVVVPSGQTFVIGGLSNRVIRKNESRVPVVGSLPLLGIPFRGRQSEADNTHLLVFVSPTIVDLRQITPAAESALGFWHDRRWRNTDRIQREIEAMEAEL